MAYATPYLRNHRLGGVHAVLSALQEAPAKKDQDANIRSGQVRLDMTHPVLFIHLLTEYALRCVTAIYLIRCGQDLIRIMIRLHQPHSELGYTVLYGGF